ncbi:acetyl-CoA synthetase-like protein [Pyrenochaeta sp. DS3sAY3a]|nr:acetyl-CoA synthetase-like protein [Pyrenochaeta sp. DS3sAY3a]
MGSMPEEDAGYPSMKLLMQAMEEKAKWTPQDTIFRSPLANWEVSGYRTITWKQYINAVNKLAYWLDEKLGKATNGIETVAYFGPDDARYAIILPVCIKTGRRVFIPDGRMTKHGLNNLLEKTECKTWLYAEDEKREGLLGSDLDLPKFGLPSLEWMLDSEEQESYPYDKTFEQAAHDGIVIIHTSGTTGDPKPIYLTHAMFSVTSTYLELSRRHWPQGLAYDSWIGKTCLCPCPPQWIAGMHTMVMSTTFLNTSTILLPINITDLTPDIFKKVLQMNKVDGIKCPPHTIHNLYKDPETRALLKSLEFVGYLGAPLDRAIGDDLCQYTRLTPLIGATENGDQLSVRPLDRKLWYTHDFVPENGHIMVPFDGGDSEDLHELFIGNPKSGRKNPYQTAVWNRQYNGSDRIETKELYAPVKDLDGRTRWVFTARRDDLTKLDWLAKFHAQDIETRIQRHPDVKGVFVGGEGRPTPYVIIEVEEGVLERKSESQLLDELYFSVVSEANKADIEEIQIPKETVLIAKSEKPLKRNLKQGIVRKGVEKDYSEEIEKAYLALKLAGASAA